MSSCRRWADWQTIALRHWADKAAANGKRWTRRSSEQAQHWAREGRRHAVAWADKGYVRCLFRADERFSQRRTRARNSWFSDVPVRVANWIGDGWYWAASGAWMGAYLVVNAAWQSLLVAAQVLGWVLLLALKLLCWLGLWLGKLICITYDATKCVVLELGSTRRRPASRIKHVFVLMLENRSFDHMLGFAGLEGVDAVSGEPTRAEDLVGNPQFNVDPKDPATRIFASTPADFQISYPHLCPGHEFADTVTQLCGPNAHFDPHTGKYPPINNSGFIASYRSIGALDPGRIMQCYAPEQVPVLTTLAREFALCDHWFSSIPGPTWPNRFFLHAASSGGLDDSPSHSDAVTRTLLEGYHFHRGTIFDRLEDRCLDWTVFMGDELPVVFAMSGMTAARLQGHFQNLEDFEAIINDPEFSSSYIFIEPSYGNVLPTSSGDFTGGNSQHPLDNILPGEELIKRVYETIRNSPNWNNSLLVITYDEHGGFFDHVAPPAAVSPGDKIADEENNRNNFSFTQLGVRVPTIVISPYIRRGTIDHTVYDHTSVLATVESLFGLKPLTRRDRRANSFYHLLSLNQPRTDAPTVLPDPVESSVRFMTGRGAGSAAPIATPPGNGASQGAAPVDPALRGFLRFSFLKEYASAPAPAKRAVLRKFLKIEKKHEAVQFMREVGMRARVRKRKRKPRKTIGKRLVRALRAARNRVPGIQSRGPC
jgi:phospholipase C